MLDKRCAASRTKLIAFTDGEHRRNPPAGSGTRAGQLLLPLFPNPFVPEVFAIKIRRMGSANVSAPLGMGPKQRGIWWLLQ